MQNTQLQSSIRARCHRPWGLPVRQRMPFRRSLQTLTSHVHRHFPVRVCMLRHVCSPNLTRIDELPAASQCQLPCALCVMHGRIFHSIQCFVPVTASTVNDPPPPSTPRRRTCDCITALLTRILYTIVCFSVVVVAVGKYRAHTIGCCCA